MKRLALLVVSVLAFLPLSDVPAKDAPRIAPGPVVVRLSSAADGKPVASVTVRLGGRSATSDPAGVAVFDGVPAGSFDLEIAHPGYARETRRAELPPGRRDEIGIAMAPVAQVPVTGRVRLEGDGRPVAGARLALVPVSVAAAMQGPCGWVSGWDGRFVVPELPAGTYRLHATSPGCRPFQTDVDLAPGMAELDVVLAGVSEPADFAVTVVDAVSGAPISGAGVVLAEAWPRGVLGGGTTDAAGRFVAAGVPTGLLNRETETGPNASTVAVTRGALTGHAEAGGYVPGLVSWQPGEALVVRLDPLRSVKEREPNDDLASAQPITAGMTVETLIDRPGDHDCFRFRLPYPGRVHLDTVRGAGVWLHFWLRSADGTTVADWALAGAGPAAADSGWLPAGDYVLEVREWGDSAAATQSTTVRVSFSVAPDPNEPNDSAATARLLRDGQEVRGFTCPVGDQDCFRFEIERPGRARFTTPYHPLWRRLRIEDVRGGLIAEAALAGAAGAVEAELSPGWYVLRVLHWSDSDAHPDPYSVRMEVCADDRVDDTAQPEAAVRLARPLPLCSLAGETIFPVGDRDYYRVTVPSAGRLHARLARCPEIWMRLRILDARRKLLAESAVSGGPGETTVDTAGPATLYLEVLQWSDDAAAVNPYLVSTWFEPCDETEAVSRNDEPAFATPLELGEVQRGTLHPNGDEDWYSIVADTAGRLEFSGFSQGGLWSRLGLYDARRRPVAEAQFAGGGMPVAWAVPVLAGEYFVRMAEWSDSAGVPLPYELRVGLVRVEPGETEPLAADPARRLTLGEAQAFRIDQVGDHDRFTVDVPAEGTFRVRVRKPAGIWMNASLTDDRSGARVAEWGITADAEQSFAVEAKGPTRYRLQVREWSDAAPGPTPGWLLVDLEDRAIPAETVAGTADPFDPTLVSFARAEVAGMARADRVEVDADGDGRADLDVPADGTSTFRYPSEGLYRATALLHGRNGVVTRFPFWVEAVGPGERKGVRIVVDQPSEGQTIEDDTPLGVRAISYSGARISGVFAAVDGRALPASYSAPHSIEVPWGDLGPGEHELVVTAADASGDRAALRRTFRVSEYFDLTPADGAALSGNAVRVSWRGGAFGPAAVKYRARGAEEWKTVVGASGRERVVTLSGLEAGTPYEWQPVGAGEAGPVRTVTRVKGLAFGRARYGASIARDYDQRVPISVRNHAEAPMSVSLVCGKPGTPDLLVGFVGEGSEGAPIDLGPGEEREFMLVFSAQDAVHPEFTVPLRISSPSGYSDEAEIEVAVKLPVVKLVWEEKGDLPQGIGKLLYLRNEGDSLTDLSIRSESSEMTASPSVDHGLFPAGGVIEVRALPRLHEGFHAAEGTIVAKAVNRSSATTAKVALKEGEQVYAVDLAPASDDPESEAIQHERALAAAYMNPASVDWSRRTNGTDTDGDGKADRFVVDIPAESTRWIGLDTDGDGEIDTAQADIGPDGRVDFSAVRGPDGWEQTNLVDAHLEVGFTLPWARSAYEKHDVDVVMNDAVVGKLRDTIPEGNYTFRLPPAAFRFGEGTAPADNLVTIRSKHLRGGHYVVSSDFRMKLNLTGTRAFAVARSQAEAEANVRATPGLVLESPDLSISSEDLSVRGEPVAGAPITVTVPVRNLGARTARQVEIALRSDSGGGEVEIARAALAEVPPSGEPVPVEIAVAAPGGRVTLTVVVDPEERTADPDRSNNVGRLPFEASGDAAAPAVEILSPAPGERRTDPVVAVAANASDDAGIARVEVRVDRGLWARLARTGAGYEAKTLLQPGPHVLTVRATDTSGNVAEKQVEVAVDVAAPRVEILEPAEGAAIDARDVEVVAACGEGVARVAARANGGPWQPGEVGEGGRATVRVDLSFGEAVLEVMAVDASGVRATASRRVSCTKQATEDEAAGPGGEGEGPAAPLDVPGVGPVDPFGEESPVVAGPDAFGPPGGEPGGGEEDVDVPDDPGEDGLYGSEPPEGADPAALEGLDEEEAALDGPEGDDENLDPEEWLDDPDADTTEDPELADPDEPVDLDYEPEDMEAWDEMPVDGAAPGGDDGGAGGAGGGFPGPAGAPASGGTGGGGYVGVRQHQADWYCTNRPVVGVRFQLPDWLKKKNLPMPGTEAFEKLFQERLSLLRARGIDTSKLEAFRKVLQNRCGRLTSPDELPGFLQSLGFKEMKTADPAKLKEWREKMAAATDSFMLRLLHSNDPSLIAEGLKARSDALGQFDKASQEAAEAVIETIKANQKITEDLATMVPYLNIAISARALYSGESLSGDKLGKLDMVLHTLTLAGPAMKLLRDPTLRRAAASIGNKAMWAGEKTLLRLAGKMGVSPERLKAAFQAMSNSLGNARIAAGEKLFGKVWAAEQRFLNSPAGRQAAELAKRDVAQAKSLLNRIAQARAAGDKATYRKLIGALQGNKTAQGLLNSGKYSNTFRAALDKTHRAMGRLADKRTIAEVMKNPKVQKQIEALAKKFGVKAEDIYIRARNVSGNVKTLKTVGPGEMLKYGADRDVVFQFTTKSRYGYPKSLADVHHKLVEKVYARNLRQITGRSMYEMDHIVTSRWHPEAYNAGLNPNTLRGREAIGDIISGKAAGRLTRPSDIRDTVIHKGKEWIEAGNKIAERGRPALGNQKIKEGMRQMTKEFDRQVAQFLKAKGLDSARALPPRLRQGMEIFRKVQQGATVEQAKAMLKALTPKGGMPVTPETIVEDLGHFVEFLNKWGLGNR